jgi:prophage antirepressor-like protein
MSSLVSKKFQDLNVTVYGTYDKPLFKAKDIGNLLGIKNIRESIKNFNEKQKGVILTDTPGGSQEVIMLTEHGLHELLFISRKPIAKTFRGWVSDIIVEIRKTGEYKINKETKMLATNDYIVDQFDKKSIAYIGIVEENEDYTIAKYGHTSDIKRRTNAHRNTYGGQFNMSFALESKAHYEVEKQIQNHNDLQSRKVKNYKDQEFKELLRLDKNFTMDNLIDAMKLINLNISKNSSLELEKERTKQIEAQEKTKQMEIQLKMMELQSKQQVIPIQQEEPVIINQVQEQPIIQEETVIQIPDVKDFLEIVPKSKIYLLVILQKYPGNEMYLDTGYNNYHGYSDFFKKKVEMEIEETFCKKAIKNNGRIYYDNIRLVGCTSFYSENVYKSFVETHVSIPVKEVRFQKIPPGMFKYKVEYNELIDMFYEFAKNVPAFHEIKYENIRLNSIVYTQLYKADFIEMICKICQVKAPSYTSKNIRYFNGITLA